MNDVADICARAWRSTGVQTEVSRLARVTGRAVLDGITPYLVAALFMVVAGFSLQIATFCLVLRMRPPAAAAKGLSGELEYVQ